MNREEFLKFNDILPPQKARFIRGPTGIGKTSLVYQIAERWKYDVVRLALSEYDPGEIVGMPYIESGVMKYARPFWWPTKGKTILLLDEVNLCQEIMQPVAMRISLDREVGGNKLCDETVVFAAGNGAEYLPNPMSQAHVRRYAVIDLLITVDEWIDWAEDNRVNRVVLDFIKANKTHLDTPEELVGKPDIVVPCRSSWTDFASFLDRAEAHNLSIKEICQSAIPFVGESAAGQLKAWLSNGQSENHEPLKTKPSFVEVATNLKKLAKNIGATSKDKQHEVLQYVMSLGKEPFSAFVSFMDAKDVKIINQFPDVAQFAMSSLGIE